MQQVPRSEPSNIRGHRTKSRRPGDLATGSFASLVKVAVKIHICMLTVRILLHTGHLLYSREYVEIKCQQDATDGFFIADLIACSTCFGHHYAHHQEVKSIIQWLLPVVLGALVFKFSVWCGAEGYVSGLGDAALQILLLAQHVSGTITPIIRSSRVLYRWLLPVGCMSGLQDAALQILLLAQHVSGTIMPIISS